MQRWHFFQSQYLDTRNACCFQSSILISLYQLRGMQSFMLENKKLPPDNWNVSDYQKSRQMCTVLYIKC